ncbi:hypothetical protein D3C76_1760930 [compost metagenome]
MPIDSASTRTQLKTTSCCIALVVVTRWPDDVSYPEPSACASFSGVSMASELLFLPRRILNISSFLEWRHTLTWT